MGRVCNGCLKESPIVNEVHGYCEYCNIHRMLKGCTEILEGLDALEKLNETQHDKDN